MKETIGMISTKTWDALVTNWKTSGSAIVASAAMFVVSQPDGFDFSPQVTSIAKWVMAGGIAMFGIAAKDHSKSGNPDLTKKKNEEQNISIVSEVGKLS